MATWNKEKVNPSNVNSGAQYEDGDVVRASDINAAENNAFYAVDFAEAMADAPDTSDINVIGTPSVTLIDNVKDGKTYKKFKFSNMKGSDGDIVQASSNADSTTIDVFVENNTDKTFSNAAITAVNITIPATIEHGQFAGINFVSGGLAPTVTFTNNNSLPLKKLYRGIPLTNYTPSTNVQVSMLFACNGLAILCYISEA